MRHSVCIASLIIGLRRYLLGILRLLPPHSLGTKSSWHSPVRIKPRIFKVEAESGDRLVFDVEDSKYMAEAKGDTMIDIPDPLNDPQWKGPLEAGTKKHLNDVTALGLDPQAVYEKAKEASAACKV